jgi:ABC-type branched-subunit amino acid transport system ATPase component
MERQASGVMPAPGDAGPTTVELEVSGLTVEYGGVAALDNLSFRHDGGGVVGLIGPNGAGKTTLLNVLSGVVRPSSGRALLGGRDLVGLRVDQIARRGVTRTFQNLEVFGSLSVLDHVLLPRTANGRGPSRSGLSRPARLRRRDAADHRAALELLGQVGVAAHADSPASSLAYGLQRRVEIARALAGDPELILLDEPLAGLSRAESAALVELFGNVAARGVTVLLVEHDVESVLAVSDRVLVLNHGRLLADGTPEQVSGDPAVQAAYLGEEWE